jgi:pre-mRNA-splicing factor SYF1
MIDATAIEEDGPIQMKVHKSLKLWSFYVDMEESLRTLNYTCAVYERILILQIATPQFSIMPIFLR